MPIGVLFADIRGFTALAEAVDPESLRPLLARFYAAAERVLFPEAIVDKLVGDQVMALYIPRSAGSGRRILAVIATVGR